MEPTDFVFGETPFGEGALASAPVYWTLAFIAVVLVIVLLGSRKAP